MTNREQDVRDRPEGVRPAGYEPPRVERVLNPADLEREVMYAVVAASN